MPKERDHVAAAQRDAVVRGQRERRQARRQPGVAFDPYGREILLTSPHCLTVGPLGGDYTRFDIAGACPPNAGIVLATVQRRPAGGASPGISMNLCETLQHVTMGPQLLRRKLRLASTGGFE